MWDVYGCLISGGWLKNVHLIQQFPLRDIEYRQTEVTFCWTAGQLWTHVKSTVWRTWHCWLQDFSGRAGFLADASDSRFLTTTCWAGWGMSCAETLARILEFLDLQNPEILVGNCPSCRLPMQSFVFLLLSSVGWHQSAAVVIYNIYNIILYIYILYTYRYVYLHLPQCT